ncbi:MAG: threonine synthase [Planctomycetota bacterium]
MSALCCPACGSRRGADADVLRCGCGELLELEHPAPDAPREAFARPAAPSGVWRFAEVVDPGLAPEERVTLAEGNTPLLCSAALSRFAGLERLALKHEGRNPTGSFKDRGMTVAVGRARRAGARLLACASTGNTAASLAAYAGAAGLPCVVLAPERGTALGKLSQAIAHGARTLLLRGDFDEGMRLVLAAAEEGRVALVNSANPWRLEGQKTIVLELLAQRGWEPPDWIVFPAGNLGNCAAFGKALREARAFGWIDRVPRLAAVQAEGAAPFAAAFGRGFDRLEPVRAETFASAIRIGDPVSYRRAVRSLRETGGVALSVSDDEIRAAKRAVDRAGIGAEPGSCAAVAGLRALRAAGTVGPDDSAVCVLTGHVLKDPDANLEAAAPEVLDPEAVGAAIGSPAPRG